MSIFRRAMNRLANRLWAGRKVTLRFTADYRIAGFTLPLIERLLLDISVYQRRVHRPLL